MSQNNITIKGSKQLINYIDAIKNVLIQTIVSIVYLNPKDDKSDEKLLESRSNLTNLIENNILKLYEKFNKMSGENLETAKDINEIK
jgi:hypothetical protein